MSENIGVGKGSGQVGGYFYRAPIGTALPTDATTALPAAYKFVSKINRDGVTTVYEGDSIEENDWADQPIFSERTNQHVRKRMTLVSNTMEANKVKHGDTAVTGTEAAFSVKHGTFPREEYVYVWETLVNDHTKKRSVLPRGKCTANDDVTEQAGSVLGSAITITGLYDETAGYAACDFYATTTTTGA